MNARELVTPFTKEVLQESNEFPFGCGFVWLEVKGVKGKALEALKKFGFEKRSFVAGYWLPVHSDFGYLKSQGKGPLDQMVSFKEKIGQKLLTYLRNDPTLGKYNFVMRSRED